MPSSRPPNHRDQGLDLSQSAGLEYLLTSTREQTVGETRRRLTMREEEGSTERRECRDRPNQPKPAL